MNLHASRFRKDEDGVFSLLEDENGKTVAVTLEHAYGNEDLGYKAKIHDGVYQCIRGKHRLEGMTEDFETFEITGIEGHTNLLFHWGNWNKDSEGCILLGAAMVDSVDGKMVSQSRKTFGKFMNLQQGVDQFTLTVT